MKTHTLEIQKLKAAANTPHGEVIFKVDALISPRQTLEGLEPTSVLVLSEANARVLAALLKSQLLEFDKRKARSQR